MRRKKKASYKNYYIGILKCDEFDDPRDNNVCTVGNHLENAFGNFMESHGFSEDEFEAVIEISGDVATRYEPSAPKKIEWHKKEI